MYSWMKTKAHLYCARSMILLNGEVELSVSHVQERIECCGMVRWRLRASHFISIERPPFGKTMRFHKSASQNSSNACEAASGICGDGLLTLLALSCAGFSINCPGYHLVDWHLVTSSSSSRCHPVPRASDTPSYMGTGYLGTATTAPAPAAAGFWQESKHSKLLGTAIDRSRSPASRSSSRYCSEAATARPSSSSSTGAAWQLLPTPLKQWRRCNNASSSRCTPGGCCSYSFGSASDTATATRGV